MWSRSQPTIQSAMVFLWAVIASLLTLVLGPAFLRIFRQKAGRATYWLVGLIFSLALILGGYPIFGAAMASFVVLVGVFSDLDESGQPLNFSFLMSLMVTFLLMAGGFLLWKVSYGPTWSVAVSGEIQGWIAQGKSLVPQVAQIETSTLMAQAPSVVAMLLILSLYLAVILEKRVGFWLGVQMPSRPQKLSHFRLPDSCIWLLIGALLLAFGQWQVPWIEMMGINLLNVSLLLFFIQGLSVVFQAYEAFKVHWAAQILMTFVLVVQLFLLVAFLGIIDYWVNFADKMKKKEARAEKQSQ